MSATLLNEEHIEACFQWDMWTWVRPLEKAQALDEEWIEETIENMAVAFANSEGITSQAQFDFVRSSLSRLTYDYLSFRWPPKL